MTDMHKIRQHGDIGLSIIIYKKRKTAGRNWLIKHNTVIAKYLKEVSLGIKYCSCWQ
jgi:hypothetical protein